MGSNLCILNDRFIDIKKSVPFLDITNSFFDRKIHFLISKN